MSGLATQPDVSAASTQRDSTVPAATRVPASVRSATSTSASSPVQLLRIAAHVSGVDLYMRFCDGIIVWYIYSYNSICSCEVSESLTCCASDFALLFTCLRALEDQVSSAQQRHKSALGMLTNVMGCEMRPTRPCWDSLKIHNACSAMLITANEILFEIVMKIICTFALGDFNKRVSLWRCCVKLRWLSANSSWTVLHRSRHDQRCTVAHARLGWCCGECTSDDPFLCCVLDANTNTMQAILKHFAPQSAELKTNIPICVACLADASDLCQA